MAQLHIRPIDDDAAERIRRSARNRGLTLGEYVARLEDLRRLIQRGDDEAIEDAGLALPKEE